VNPVDRVRAALQLLPAECRYHGAKVTAVDRWGEPDARYGGACCATGVPALARRRGLDALATLAGAWETRPTVSGPQIAAQAPAHETCKSCGSPLNWMNPRAYMTWIFGPPDGGTWPAGVACTDEFHDGYHLPTCPACGSLHPGISYGPCSDPFHGITIPKD
jgi:hypothetical protein